MSYKYVGLEIMKESERNLPRALSAVLSDLFAVKGYGRPGVTREIEAVWHQIVGEPDCWQTQLGDLRHGVLDIIVAHSALLEELQAFRKPLMLRALRRNANCLGVRDIRFRIGRVRRRQTTDGP